MTMNRAIQPSLVGEPCGQHGNYTFYKAFKYQLKANSRVKVLMLGEFFFLRISPHDDPCIGELQLLWDDRNSDQLLSSTRLYFLPEQTPEGRIPSHGEHEVLAASEKVILRLSDLVSWITDQVDWMTGLKTQTVMQTNSSHINTSDTLDKNSCKQNQWQSSNHLINQSLHPIAINSGLDFNDVINEKHVNGDVSSSSSVVVLSYPRYCRYRALLRRIEGRESEWINKPAVQLAINSLGIPSTTNKINILFCRDTFEHEALLQNDLNCDHLAPKLKGRPRKKTTIIRSNSSVSNCQRSSSPESNTSDESKTSQIRTTRRSALNKTNSTEKSVHRKNSVVKNNTNNNKVNNNNTNNNPTNVSKLKDICIKSEQTFLKQLNKFMRDRKTPIQRVPHLGFKQIDLYFFYTHAQQLGGYDNITSNKLWKKLYDAMGGDPGSTSAATCTRRHYERLLLPFERHLNGEQEKKRGRKAKDSTPKKTKNKSQKNNENTTTGATNGLKIKKKVGKQVVNGLKTKIKCNEDNYSDDTSSTNDKPIETQEPEAEEEPKQPKLIVKFNLLKVKNSSLELDIESNNTKSEQNVDKSCVKQELVNNKDINDKKIVDKLENQKIYDFNSDTEDTDDDKKLLFEPKRPEPQPLAITEEEDNIEIKTIEENKNSIVEMEVESKLVVETVPEEEKSCANSDSVIHLSPVSDICEEEEPICDNTTDLSTNSPIKTETQPTLQQNLNKQSVLMDIKPDIKPLLSTSPLSTGQPSVGAAAPQPLPFPVAASPLFSISTLVNSVPSVKVESMASPPPLPLSLSTSSVPPTQPQYVSSTSMRGTAPKPIPLAPPMMKSSFESFVCRPTVIKTTNPMVSTQFQPKPQFNYKTKPSAVITSVPMPAHSVVKPKGMEPQMETKSQHVSDIVCNDVLDLSVKKRCLEADSRTSPSQILIDGPNGLDLSVKKRKLDSPKLEVPKPKLDHRINHSITPPSNLSMRSVTPLAPPPTPPKLCPPQSPVNNIVPQSVPKSPVLQSVHYKNQSHSQNLNQNHNKSVSQIELQKYMKDKQKTQYQSYHKSNRQSPHHQSPQLQPTHYQSPPIPNQMTLHPSPNHHSPRHHSQSPQRQSQTHPQQVSHHLKQSQTYHQKELQSDRHFDKQLDRLSDRHFEKQMDRLSDRHFEKQMDRHLERHFDKQLDRQMDKHVNRNLDKHIDRHLEKHQISKQSQLLVKPQVIHPAVSLGTQSVSHQSIHNSVNEHYNQRDNNHSHRQQSAHHNSPKHSLQSPALQSRQQQSPNHRIDRIDEKMSSKLLSPTVVSLPSIPSLSSSALTTTPTQRNPVPAISEYNPSLPTFTPGLYAAPNFWWPNGSAFNPTSVSTPSPYMSAASIGPISPHLMASHPLLSAGAYPPSAAEHLMAQLDSAKAVAAYKQFLDQHHSQQTHNPYQLFQHSFYATK